ncbi:hypothetical protein GEO21_01180 [Sphingobacterium faecium]|uniref:hypothetical protein n=1 Tax=Sphingobacterium faecium TaxID=34087 RepID=UPI001291A958|nr:hypothetical protein [Sphingobacterium faecium]MQP26126.1 hypothetical protein [Sphingobacterium faecium]
MKKITWLIVLCVGSMMAFAQQKPNIVIIISYHQSYQNSGAYDSKLGHTPNIDRIPFEIRFNKTDVTNFFCDTRGPMLLMGTYNHRMY